MVRGLFPESWDAWIPVVPSSSPVLGRYFSAEMVGEQSLLRATVQHLLSMCDWDKARRDGLAVYLRAEDGRIWKMEEIWPIKIDILPARQEDEGLKASVGFPFKRILEYTWRGRE